MFCKLSVHTCITTLANETLMFYHFLGMLSLYWFIAVNVPNYHYNPLLMLIAGG